MDYIYLGMYSEISGTFNPLSVRRLIYQCMTSGVLLATIFNVLSSLSSARFQKDYIIQQHDYFTH